MKPLFSEFMTFKDGDFRGSADDASAEHLVRLFLERERTKRWLIASVTLLVICACGAMLFAPAGREQMSYILGGILFVLALGAIGSSRFLLRIPGVAVDTRNLPDNPKPSTPTEPKK